MIFHENKPFFTKNAKIIANFKQKLFLSIFSTKTSIFKKNLRLRHWFCFLVSIFNNQFRDSTRPPKKVAMMKKFFVKILPPPNMDQSYGAGQP